MKWLGGQMVETSVMAVGYGIIIFAITAIEHFWGVPLVTQALTLIACGVLLFAVGAALVFVAFFVEGRREGT